MRIARSYYRKIPTELEYRNFKGGRFKELWFMLDDNWVCPSCSRNKKELMRWKKDKWTCSFHQHHDHGNRWKGTRLICNDCNSADGIVKRMLKLPKNWSFSVDELSEIVKCEPNGTIESVDLDTAFDIFNDWIQYFDF